MEKPIQDSQAFLNALYRRYDYLQDFPCEFQGMMLDKATSLGMLQTDSFLGALLGYPVENETLTRNHFPYLPEEVNLSIAHYRQLTPVQPWPQPIIGVAMTGTQGTVTGVHSVPVVLQRVGNVQVWYGQDVGLIFEAFLEGQVQNDPSFEVLMNQLWSKIEQYLTDQGVSKVYTLARDPALDERWLRSHLERRGYQPEEEGVVTWVKQ